MRRIELETGEARTGLRKRFFLEISDVIHMGLPDGPFVEFPLLEWPILIDQLEATFSPKSIDSPWWKRYFNRGNYREEMMKNYPRPPLGSNRMKIVVLHSVASTASYQLYLASVELAEFFLFEQDEGLFKTKMTLEKGRVRTKFHGGGGRRLFLLPNDRFINKEHLVDELLNGNRICKATFNGEVTRYYTSYATPFTPDLSKEAKKFWYELCDYVR